MSGPKADEMGSGFLKAKELVVKVEFECDQTPEGPLKAKQAKKLIADMILLGVKRGRPSDLKEIENAAA